jgi:hypothetical protein
MLRDNDLVDADHSKFINAGLACGESAVANKRYHIPADERFPSTPDKNFLTIFQNQAVRLEGRPVHDPLDIFSRHWFAFLATVLLPAPRLARDRSEHQFVSARQSEAKRWDSIRERYFSRSLGLTIQSLRLVILMNGRKPAQIRLGAPPQPRPYANEDRNHRNAPK